MVTHAHSLHAAREAVVNEKGRIVLTPMNDSFETKKDEQRAISNKLRVMQDFGIKKEYIPDDFFAGLRGKSDLDKRSNDLIGKFLDLLENTPEDELFKLIPDVA